MLLHIVFIFLPIYNEAMPLRITLIFFITYNGAMPLYITLISSMHNGALFIILFSFFSQCKIKFSTFCITYIFFTTKNVAIVIALFVSFLNKKMEPYTLFFGFLPSSFI